MASPWPGIMNNRNIFEPGPPGNSDMDSNRADAVCVVPEEENHVISKRYIQRIGRHNLNLRQPLFRLGRRGSHQGQRKRIAKTLTIVQVIPQ